MINTMSDMITDKKIADNVREALKQIKDEILELYTLCEDWPDKRDWRNRLYRLQLKQYFLEEIIEQQ
jgi:hypothetical protein